MNQQHQFSARMDDLDGVMAFVQAFCAEHLVPSDDGLRLQLVVEELFTNTVTHGHGGDCDSPVAVELAVEVDGLRLSFADWAPPFDPTAALAPESVAPTQIGGAGLRLLATLARDMTYARTDGANRLTLVMARRGSSAKTLQDSRENADPLPAAAQSNSRP